MNKKMVFYEVNPLYFKDSTGNGIGDIKGLANQSAYFKYLGVDTIILPQILSVYSDDKVQEYKTISSSLGQVNDIKRMISLFKKNGLKAFLELNIGTIKESSQWFTFARDESRKDYQNIVKFENNAKEEKGKKNSTAEYKFDAKTKSYYVVNEETQEVALNWQSKITYDKFIEVIRFWYGLGIDGFVLTDFENLEIDSEFDLMNEPTLKSLRKLYKLIKEIDDNVLVIGKSHKIEDGKSKNYTEGITKVFDFFLSTQISTYGTSLKHGNDGIGKFQQKQLVKLVNKYLKSDREIISFGSALSGRINSRWGDDGQYFAESAKSIALMLLSTKNSSLIYYGDEIGIKNIGLTHLDDFQDEKLAERKQIALERKVSEEQFMDAQVLQNPINARALMQWNGKKNGGFSFSEKTVTPHSTSYRQINVADQFNDPSSTLNFYKSLIRISKSGKYAKIMNNGEYFVKTQKWGFGIIEIKRVLKDKELYFFINLSDKPKSVKLPKEGKVVISTYATKSYKELPKKLSPFESIVIDKYTDEAIKEQIVVQKEIEKTQEIEIKKQEKELAIQKTQEIIIEKKEISAKQHERKVQEAKRIIEADKIAKEKEAERIVKEKKEAIERAKIEKIRAEEAKKKQKEQEKIEAQKEADRLEAQKQKELEIIKAQEEKEKRELEKIKAQREKEKKALGFQANKTQDIFPWENDLEEYAEIKKTQEIALKRETKEHKAKERKVRRTQTIVVKKPISKTQETKVAKPVSKTQETKVAKPVSKTQETKVAKPVSKTQETKVAKPVSKTQETKVAKPVSKTQETKVAKPVSKTQETKVAKPVSKTQETKVAKPVSKTQETKVAKPVSKTQETKVAKPVSKTQETKVAKPVSKTQETKVAKPVSKTQETKVAKPVSKTQETKVAKPVSKTQETKTINPKAIAAPKKEEAIAAPKKEEAIAAPKKEEAIAAPKKEEAIAAPKKEEAIAAPKKEEAIAAPKKEEAIAAPKKEEAIAAPKKEEAIAAPKKEEAIAAPKKETKLEDKVNVESKPETDKEETKQKTNADFKRDQKLIDEERRLAELEKKKTQELKLAKKKHEYAEEELGKLEKELEDQLKLLEDLEK